MRRTFVSTLCAALALATTFSGTAKAEFTQIDDGTGTQQVVVDGSSVYALKNNGNIFQYSQGRWQMIDDGSGTREIEADAGRVYAAKNNGKLFRRSFGSWSALAMKGTQQVVPSGKDIYTLETSGAIFYFASSNGSWTQVDNGSGTRQIAVDPQSGLYVLKNNGNIYHQNGSGGFDLVDDGSGTHQIAAAGGVLYALKDNGNIWRQNGSWEKIDDGTGSAQIAVDGDTLYCLKNNGNIWMYRSDSWSQVDNGSGTKMICAKDGTLAVLKESGNIFTADGSTLASGTRAETFNRLYGAADR